MIVATGQIVFIAQAMIHLDAIVINQLAHSARREEVVVALTGVNHIIGSRQREEIEKLLHIQADEIRRDAIARKIRASQRILHRRRIFG